MSADCSSIAITASMEQMFHTACNNCIRFSAQFFCFFFLLYISLKHCAFILSCHVISQGCCPAIVKDVCLICLSVLILLLFLRRP